MLPERFTEPSGFQWGSFTSPSGYMARCGSIGPEGTARGTIIIATGFRECIEKYFEVIRDMTTRGFAVHIMDWPGQGGSERLDKTNPQKMHCLGYDSQIATLDAFAKGVSEHATQPLILCAHSMGAHIGLRYLKEHPGVFDSAILSAPMMDVTTGKIPRLAARLIVAFAHAVGLGKKYKPDGHDWSDRDRVFEGNSLTSDPNRFNVMVDIYRCNPDMRMGDATYGWAHHTFCSIATLHKKGYLQSIKTPILMQISGDERIVDPAAAPRAAKILPQCRSITIPQARHEIWMERDDLRQQWLHEVDGFLEARLPKPPATSPRVSAP